MCNIYMCVCVCVCVYFLLFLITSKLGFQSALQEICYIILEITLPTNNVPKGVLL
jgi:hypothetical protein